MSSVGTVIDEFTYLLSTGSQVTVCNVMSIFMDSLLIAY